MTGWQKHSPVLFVIEQVVAMLACYMYLWAQMESSYKVTIVTPTSSFTALRYNFSCHIFVDGFVETAVSLDGKTIITGDEMYQTTQKAKAGLKA